MSGRYSLRMPHAIEWRCLTFALQPRRLLIAPSAVGCKRLRQQIATHFLYAAASRRYEAIAEYRHLCFESAFCS
jgi:hypothetical protein